MTPDVGWIIFKGRIHALRDRRKPRITTLCGISPLNPPKIVTFPPGDIPRGPLCQRCMVDAALASADEEPIDEALARGFVPSDQVL